MSAPNDARCISRALGAWCGAELCALPVAFAAASLTVLERVQACVHSVGPLAVAYCCLRVMPPAFCLRRDDVEALR